jgi:hypothetical protein
VRRLSTVVNAVKRFFRAYAGGCLAAFVLFPGLAAVASISLYLIGRPDWRGGYVYFLGAGVGAAACLLLALACRRYATADGAHPAAYDNLCEAYRERAGRLAAHPVDTAAEAHMTYVGTQLGLIEGTKPGVGLPWVLSTGYPGLWSRLHRVEEALISVEPPELVLEDAIRDELRIDGSRIAHADELLDKLRRAVETLVPGGVSYLAKPPTAVRVPPGAAAPTPVTANEARGVLRAIRNTVNEFRDTRREGIVRARNNLFATVIFAGLVAYVVLGVALVENVGKRQIVAGAVFYLIGATIGLFKQLRAASAADIVIEEDYGLSTARLIHTPLFSGIAGIAGVVLAALVGPIVPGPTGTTTTPTPTATTTAGSPAHPSLIRAPAALAADDEAVTTRKEVAPLADIFDLGKNTYGLIFAAVFGLTPNLLIVRLQRQAEQYKADLKSSEAGEAATPAAPA